MSKLRQLRLEYQNLFKKRREYIALFVSNLSIGYIGKIFNLDGDWNYLIYRDRIIRWYEYGNLEKLKEYNLPIISNEKLDNLIIEASENISQYLSTKEGQKEQFIENLYFWINSAIHENSILEGDGNITYIELNDDNTILTIYCHHPEKLIGFGNGLIMAIKEKINDNYPQITKIKVEKHTKYEF